MKATVLLLFVATVSIGQVTWHSEVATPTTSTFNAVGVADFDGDLLDDVLAIDYLDVENAMADVYIRTQNSDGTYSSHLVAPRVSGEDIWSSSIADVNNDGFPDILLGGLGVVPMAFISNGPLSYDRTAMGFSGFFAQGSNALDIDRDGWIDAMVCNDDSESYIYKNYDGLLEEWDLIDMQTAMPSDNSGNYSSIWYDADNDGDLDLYIAKCRAGVTDPTDPRRINALYINDNGNYVERAADFGLDIGRQSWSVTSGDIDNDGDEDLYITNHYSSDQLLINEGTTYSVIDMDLPTHFGLQGLLQDIDLDGLQDIILIGGGNTDMIVYNRGDLVWEVDSLSLLPFSDGGSVTTGDLDNDGDVDLYKASCIDGQDAIVYNDQSSGNHFLKITLDHAASAAIMATVTIYGDWGQQMQRVISGESYGVSTAPTLVYGLAEHSKVDSIIVQWHDLNRTKTWYGSSPANTHLILSPEGCVGRTVTPMEATYTICDGEVATVSLPQGYIAYRWSDGNTDQTRELGAGKYWAQLTRLDGCDDRLYPFEVRSTAAYDEVITATASSICNEEPVMLRLPPLTEQIWSTGQTTSSLVVTVPGIYSVSGSDACGNTYIDTVSIADLSADAPNTFSTSLFPGETLNLPWTTTLALRNLEGKLVQVDSTLRLGPYLQDTTLLYAAITISSGKSSHVGIDTASEQFASDQFNSGIAFTVTESIWLRSIDVFTDRTGVRRLLIEDSDGHRYFSNDYPLVEGKQELRLDHYMEAGEYVLFTDPTVNAAELGHVGPRLSRSSDAIFPYSSEGIRLDRTLNGIDNYYYFYNWQVETSLGVCESEPAEINITILPVSTSETQSTPVLVYPNPTAGILTISTDEAIDHVVALDNAGRTYSLAYQDGQVDMSSLSPGAYTISIVTASRVSSHRVLLLR